MTKARTLALLAASAFALGGAQAHAQSRNAPAASLGGSCQDIQTLNSGYVTAECRDTQGRYRWSSIYYPQCRSDLTNRDGMLACLGAEASGGSYVQQSSPAQAPTASSILGALAGAFLGVGPNQNSYNNTAPYQPGARYPAWGEPGYGDPQTDPRFGQQGWGYGSRGEWVPIARRQTWLEQRIAQGEQQGSLTRGEAADLRRELSDLDRLERRYESNGLTNSERADLDRRFDALGARIQGERRDDQNTWANINDRQARLDARIDAGVRDRSLTAREAAQLRADFKDLARMEDRYRRNGLTSSERADLDRRFDELSSRIKDQRADEQDGWANINQRQARLDARIDAGLRDRSLTTREAAQLRAEFQALARLEDNYRRGGLTNSERADLDRRFDALSSRIKDQRDDEQDGWANINQRQARLDARIDAGLRDRSLTTYEAAQLRAEFQALARLEDSYRRGGLTSSERADLDRRFDALSSRIKDQRDDDQAGWADINQRQARLDARIDAGLRDRSLTTYEAAQLRAEFQALVRLEDSYRRGGLTSAEQADLDRRFDALSGRIRDDRRD